MAKFFSIDIHVFTHENNQQKGFPTDLVLEIQICEIQDHTNI